MNMRHNNDPSYTGDVYHTPHYKINAITRNHGLNPDAKQASLEYSYEDGKGSTSNTFYNYYVENDDYVLPPQDRNDTQEVRPRKSEKGKEQDIYDEDHYTLARNSGFGKDFSSKAEKGNVEGVDDEGHYSIARNSGFGKDFSKPDVINSSVSKSQPESNMPKYTNKIIICIIIGILGVGVMLAGVIIGQLGRSMR